MREAELIAELLAKPAPSAETVEAGRLRLRREGSRRWPNRGLLFSGGFTTLAAGGAAVAVVVSGVGGPVPPERPADAKTVLLAAAEQAESAPAPSGKYWYFKNDSWMENGGGQPAKEPLQNFGGEFWKTTKGWTWTRMMREKNRPGKLMKYWDRKFSFCNKDLTYQDIQNLPTEHEALHATASQAMLHDDGGPVPPDEQRLFLVSCMTRLISITPAPPKVRAAAFRALASMPEAQNRGTTKDRIGRSGTTLLITIGKNQAELIVDTTVPTVLETRLTSDDSPHDLIETSTVHAAYWTDTPPS